MRATAGDRRGLGVRVSDYRGSHHFSIAGRGSHLDRYLGARSECGPGIHIYPSVAAQLSIARDHSEFEVPRRGTEPIDLGHPDLSAAFLNDTGPTARSARGGDGFGEER